MNKQPEKTKETRKKIMDSFYALYKENRIEKISIGAIMKKAKMNRGTFYEYFTDIYDVLDQVEDELLKKMTDAIEKQCLSITVNDQKGFQDFTESFAQIFIHFENDIFQFIGANGDPAFQRKLKAQLREHLIVDLDLEKEDPSVEYLLVFVISSITNLMEYWYYSNKNLSDKDFLFLVQKLVQEGVLGYLDKDLEDLAVFQKKL